MEGIWDRVATEEEIVNCNGSYANCDSCKNRDVCFALMTEIVLSNEEPNKEK